MGIQMAKDFQTGTGAMTYSFAPGIDIELLAVKLHLTEGVGGIVENFTIVSDSSESAAYDTKHYSIDMNTVQDLVWYPTRRIYLRKGDELDFAWANTNGRTWGLEIQYR